MHAGQNLCNMILYSWTSSLSQLKVSLRTKNKDKKAMLSFTAGSYDSMFSANSIKLIV